MTNKVCQLEDPSFRCSPNVPRDSQGAIYEKTHAARPRFASSMSTTTARELRLGDHTP